MMIIVNIILLIIGFVALVKGADIFVDGSAALARNFKVPALIIGLTIVALGTSAPELAVSVSAALQGSNEIALSNVVGSNIFNLIVVLGFCALLHSVPVDRQILKRDFPLAVGATIFVFLVTGSKRFFSGDFFGHGMEEVAGRMDRLPAIILLIAFVIYILMLIMIAKKQPQQVEEEEKTMATGKCILFILIGLAFIVGGGQAVVYSAKEIARSLGMTETLIGLTVIAMGTSLPELVTSAVAAKKGQTELAVGNVLGSNSFNLMFILGISATIRPMDVNFASVYDLLILLGITLITYLFSFTSKKIVRWEGVIMLLLYAADMAFAIVR